MVNVGLVIAAKHIAQQDKIQDAGLPTRYKVGVYTKTGAVAGMIIGGIVGGVFAPTNLGVSIAAGIAIGGMIGLIAGRILNFVMIKIFKPERNIPSETAPINPNNKV